MNFKFIKNFQISWSCFDENKENVNLDSDTEELNIENGLQKLGKLALNYYLVFESYLILTFV